MAWFRYTPLPMFGFLTDHTGSFLALLFIGMGALAVWNLVLLNKLKRRQAHHDELLQAVENEGVEGLLTKQARDITRLSHDAQELYQQGERMQQRLDTALTRIGVLRFNPFGDAGGNQSFVCAFLNTHGSGMVISSLHHRAGNRIYAKSITKGVSDHPLSNEEQEAIRKAMMAEPLKTAAHVGVSEEGQKQNA